MGASRPVWSTRRQELVLFLRGVTVRVAGRVAIVVGTILSAVNQGSVILAGDATGFTWTRIAVNYLIPFVVASFGYLAGCRAEPGSPRFPVAGRAGAAHRVPPQVPTRRLGAPAMKGRDREMVEAVFNGQVIARSEHTVQVEGNHYFPPASIRSEFLTRSRAKSLCPWKGIASYYTVAVEGIDGGNAAWTYRHPSPLARRIKNHVAFTPVVSVDETA